MQGECQEHRCCRRHRRRRRRRRRARLDLLALCYSFPRPVRPIAQVALADAELEGRVLPGLLGAALAGAVVAAVQTPAHLNLQKVEENARSICDLRITRSKVGDFLGELYYVTLCTKSMVSNMH